MKLQRYVRVVALYVGILWTFQAIVFCYHSSVIFLVEQTFTAQIINSQSSQATQLLSNQIQQVSPDVLQGAIQTPQGLPAQTVNPQPVSPAVNSPIANNPLPQLPVADQAASLFTPAQQTLTSTATGFLGMTPTMQNILTSKYIYFICVFEKPYYNLQLLFS